MNILDLEEAWPRLHAAPTEARGVYVSIQIAVDPDRDE
jgi:hypothetical protein